MNVGSIYPFESIRDGINQVAEGGTVNVAAGKYDEADIEVLKPNITIQGPGIGSDIAARAVVNGSCEDSNPPAVFHLHKNGITLRGFEINADCEHEVHIGGVTDILVNGVTVSGNAIHGGTNGVTISWGSTNDSNSPNVISGNDIYENSVGVLLESAFNNKVLQNNIHNNFGNGIKLSSCNECDFGSPIGNLIGENTIKDNGALGVSNQDVNKNVFNATRNFWGDASGPRHTALNPNGAGNSVSDRVLVRPFYTDPGKTTLSIFSPPVGEFNPASFFSNGVFSLPSGATQTNTASVTINEKATFSVSTSGGTSSVLLPSGTLITKSGGGTIDTTQLATADVSISALSGFISGTVAKGALQWGIPNLGLEFNQPITLSIFVGTSFSGQTLNVVRSTTGISGWTSDGIVSPTTCLVANGLCTFQATKASTYATTQTVQPTPTPTPASTSSSSTSGGGDGLRPANAPSCNDAAAGGAPTLLSATVSGNNRVILTWSKALDPVTNYVISYGLVSGKPLYGNPNVGGKETTSYTVGSLSGGTTYYFRVRAGNGCNAGAYSNELTATPGGEFVGTGPAAGFIPGVLAAKTTNQQETTEGTPHQQVQGAPTANTLAQPSIQFSQPSEKQSSGGFFGAIGGFFGAIFGFVAHIFGK